MNMAREMQFEGQSLRRIRPSKILSSSEPIGRPGITLSSCPVPSSAVSAHIAPPGCAQMLGQFPVSMPDATSPTSTASKAGSDDSTPDAVDRKKKNADAQAAFRARRANYIATLEETGSDATHPLPLWRHR